MKFIIKIISPAIIIVGLFFVFKSNEVHQPAGVLVPNPPTQKTISQNTNWIKDNYNFVPIASFQAIGKVLSISSYNYDEMNEFSPVDIALGWGRMSDQQITDQIDIKQQHRWYVWRTDYFPIPKEEIENSSSNIHIIPAYEDIEDKIDRILRGNIIQLRGKLVNVNKVGESWVWKSSTKRNDTGSGACEILWVDEIKIIQ
jgi:hypothetical protein